jgi:hypothetical protein
VKATQLPAVMALVSQRQKLQEMVDAAELGLINLSVGAAIASDSIKAVVRPAIIGECRAQIALLDRELRTYGVEVD